jgi:multidrug efflux pump subunit AcrB
MCDAVRRELTRLKGKLPAGVAVDIACEGLPGSGARGGPEYVLVQPHLPDAANSERTIEVLQRCQKTLADVERVQDMLALDANPGDDYGDGPCLLVCLAPAECGTPGHAMIAYKIRFRLGEEIREAAFQVFDLSQPGASLARPQRLQLAVCGPDNVKLAQLSDRLVERLGQGKKATDLWTGPRLVPDMRLEINDLWVSQHGVPPYEVTQTLQMCSGLLEVGRFTAGGKPVPVEVTFGLARSWSPKVIAKIGQIRVMGLVPLEAVTRVRTATVLQACDRLDMSPMRKITGEPAEGVTLAELRRLCETWMEEARRELGLGPEYHLRWLD